MAPLIINMTVLNAVASMGKRGWSGGGHTGAEAFTIVNALMKPAKSMASVSTKTNIPNNPFEIMPRLVERTGSRCVPRGALTCAISDQCPPASCPSGA